DGDLGVVPLEGQAALERLPHGRLVVDDQDALGVTVTVAFGGHGAHGVGFLRRRDGGGGGSGGRGPGSPGRSRRGRGARDPALARPAAPAAGPAGPARSVGRCGLRLFAGRAKPRPGLPASEGEPPAEDIAELMPMTAPFMSISAPPELPGLREASV